MDYRRGNKKQLRTCARRKKTSNINKYNRARRADLPCLTKNIMSSEVQDQPLQCSSAEIFYPISTENLFPVSTDNLCSVSTLSEVAVSSLNEISEDSVEYDNINPRMSASKNLTAPTPPAKRIKLENESDEEQKCENTFNLQSSLQTNENFVKIEPTEEVKTENEIKVEEVIVEEVIIKEEEFLDEDDNASETSEVGKQSYVTDDEADLSEQEEEEEDSEEYCSDSESDASLEELERRYLEASKLSGPKKHEVKGTKIETTENHILQFTITLLRGKSAPRIWRRFQVPGNYTFRQFHVAIQKTMGWESHEIDYHLHAFYIVNPATGYKDRIDISEDTKLYGSKDESVTKIRDYCTVLNHKGKYEYDFGMAWEHEFVFEKAFLPEEGVKYPRCVAGAKACPPEDGVVHEGRTYDPNKFDPKACF